MAPFSKIPVRNEKKIRILVAGSLLQSSKWFYIWEFECSSGVKLE